MALLIKNGEMSPSGRGSALIFLLRMRRSPASAGIWMCLRERKPLMPAANLVFPGFIDPHVSHLSAFHGDFAKDTHETGSVAALMVEPLPTLKCVVRTAMTTRCRVTSSGSRKRKGRAPAIMPFTCR